MGCLASKVVPGNLPTSPVEVAPGSLIPVFAALDGQLVAALEAGAIKLLRADYLRDAPITQIERRQHLEMLEQTADRAVHIFLTPSEAISELRKSARTIGALTYGWQTPGHPDVDGAYLAAVRRFLHSQLGAHVRAVFWDFASLPQKPRSAAEDALFQQALAVMGDVYASAVGTLVMRHRTVPPRPAALDGQAVVLVGSDGPLDSAAAETELRRELCAHGSEDLAWANFEEQPSRWWRVRFASHADIETVAAAVKAAATSGRGDGVVGVFALYNSQPYEQRGWTTLESGVSTEALARAAFYPEITTALARLPPKLVEIDGERPVAAAAHVQARGGAGPRIESVRAAIAAATFTGKGDKEVVLALYNAYIVKMEIAMTASGEAMEIVYEGERNAAGQYEGRGKGRFVDGTVYEGEWVGGWREGRGRCEYADGNVYEGDFRAGKSEGRGTIWFANGDITVSLFEANALVGEGVRWEAGGHAAVRTRDGKPVEAISLDEARQACMRLALPFPHRAY